MTKEEALMLVKKDGEKLAGLPEEFKNDEEVVLAALHNSRISIKFASEKLKKDRDFVLKAVQLRGDSLGWVSKEFLSDKEIVLSAIKSGGVCLASVSPEMRNDEDVVKLAIKKDPSDIQFASWRLQDKLRKNVDKEEEAKILDEIRSNSKDIIYIPKCLNNKDFYLKAVEMNGDVLQYLPETFKNDLDILSAAKEFYFEAVASGDVGLKYLPEIFKNDHDILRAAVGCHNDEIEYVPENLRDDIIECVLKESWCYDADKLEILNFASSELKNNKEFMLKLVKEYNEEAFSYASPELQKDPEIIVETISGSEDAGCWLQENPELGKDKKIILKLLEEKRNQLDVCEILAYISDELKNDKEVVMAAVSKYGCALKYASEGLRNDKDVVLAAISEEHNGIEGIELVLDYTSDELKNDKEVVMAAVSQFGCALEYASEGLRNDKEVVMAAVNENGWALEYASEELRNDKDVVLAAISNDEEALEHASEELQNDKEFMEEIKLMEQKKLQKELDEINQELNPKDSQK